VVECALYETVLIRLADLTNNDVKMPIFHFILRKLAIGPKDSLRILTSHKRKCIEGTHLFCSCFIFLDVWRQVSQYVASGAWKSLLLQPPKCWDYRHELPHPASDSGV
jgi:hypothetical protein